MAETVLQVRQTMELTFVPSKNSALMFLTVFPLRDFLISDSIWSSIILANSEQSCYSPTVALKYGGRDKLLKGLGAIEGLTDMVPSYAKSR